MIISARSNSLGTSPGTSLLPKIGAEFELKPKDYTRIEFEGHQKASIPYFAELVRSCGNAKDLSEAKRLCARMCRGKYLNNIYLANLVVEMYGKCGSLEDARASFDSIEKPNLFSWTIMVAAYAQNGHLQEARAVFDTMPEQDITSWNVMIQAYTQQGHLEEARVVFDRMSERDIVSWSTMITAYAQFMYVEEARRMFDRMPQRNVVSWTALVAAYAQNGHLEEAQTIFNEMPERNVVSWNVMLTAYADHGRLRNAESVFLRMPEKDIVSWNGMLAAYARKGHLLQAESLFDEMPERSLVSWNSMIQAYAHAKTGNVLELFQRLNLEAKTPDEVSFICILNACSHRGHLYQGWQCFVSIGGDYGMVPSLEHYHCMIDILGRAGQLKEADELVKEMPFWPGLDAWKAMLAASKVHVDDKFGAEAANKAFQLDPSNVASYLLLSDIYAA